jgi:glycosyltransferase involved in cell wall biosynthesis
MINYVAHWEWILTKSRGSIVESIEDYEFRSICPIDNETVLSKYYKDSINWGINRKNSFGLKGIFKLIKILRTLEDKSIIHVFTIKSGFIYIVSKLFVKKDFKAILSVTGLGFLFSNNTLAKMLKTLLRPIFFLLINKIYDVIIFQNIDDKNTFLEYSRYENETKLIKSSGLDTEKYILKNSFNKNLKVIFASRLLKDKGVNEFMELAKFLEDSEIEFFIAGDIDHGNPESLNESELNELKNLNYITYLGFIDIEKELHNYDVLVSMSSHEGFSRVLLESSFVGLYVVSLENHGTKFISELENSELIPSLQIDSFIEVLKNLKVTDLKLSSKNRDYITKNYSSNEIAKHFKNIYEKI